MQAAIIGLAVQGKAAPTNGGLTVEIDVPATVQVGIGFTTVYTITNTGPSADAVFSQVATNSKDPIDNVFLVIPDLGGIPPSGCSAFTTDAQVGYFCMSSIGPNSSLAFTLPWQALQQGIVSWSALASGALSTATATTEVTPPDEDMGPNLSVSKDDGGVAATPGDMIHYTLSVANPSPQEATGVVITDTVPVYTSFDAEGSTESWNCPNGTGAGMDCTLDVGTLAMGDSRIFTFTVQVNTSIPEDVNAIVNTAVIGDDGSNGTDPNLDNNVASTVTPIGVDRSVPRPQ